MWMFVVVSEGKLYEWNVLKFFVFIFVVWFLCNRWFLKKMYILGIIVVLFGCLVVVIFMEVIRFFFLLVCNMLMGSWLLVRIIGLFRFFSMKLSVEVVYVMVFVLCRMMNLLKLL